MELLLRQTIKTPLAIQIESPLARLVLGYSARGGTLSPGFFVLLGLHQLRIERALVLEEGYPFEAMAQLEPCCSQRRRRRARGTRGRVRVMRNERAMFVWWVG